MRNLSCELIPDWGELFAVSTPWGIELNKDVLRWVVNDTVETLSNEDSHVTLLFWDGLGLEVGYKLSFVEVIDEHADCINGDSVNITFPNELLELFGGVDESD